MPARETKEPFLIGLQNQSGIWLVNPPKSCQFHLKRGKIDTRFPALIVAYTDLPRTEIPYWLRKVCPESGQVLWLVDVVVALGETSQASRNEERHLFCQATSLSP